MMLDRESLHSMVLTLLTSEASVNPDGIRDKVREVAAIPTFSHLPAEDLEWVARRIEQERTITISDPRAVVDENHRPWLHEARSAIDWFYWNRYRTSLLQKPWPTAVVNTLDRATDRILDALGNPAEGGSGWDRRGMVIGHVQSGKTSNYIGLITKAADAGFKVIVVVAGIHEVLRSQTQRRIDEGFLGWDTGKGLRETGSAASIGVGRINSQRRPATLTSTLQDFNLNTARNLGITPGHLNEPLVLVVKKHPMPLRNLLDWLQKDQNLDGPLLVIDDEADNASINIAYHREEVTTINRQLRQLLRAFRRSAYVGYTATPFANIFIDPESEDDMFGDDLFPRHFIVSLEAPSNYFGAARVFGLDSEDAPSTVLRPIKDQGVIIPLKHKKDLPIPELPVSLAHAIRCFIVAAAMRALRGDGDEHASMLVNASVYTAVQGRLASRIFDFLVVIRDALRVNHGLGPRESLRSKEVLQLKEVLESEYPEVATWEDVFPWLRSVVESVDVEAVNSRSPGRLGFEDYRDGRRVIAVGGYSLSRGLTLEGLIVSYFLRNSRTYDTLMQMARWFGYRDGYEDLCRVWITDEAADWYAHISEAMDELRAEVREMEARRATPMEFGLRVRSHPDALMVTSRVKRGRSEEFVAAVDLSAQLIETWALPGDPNVLAQNRRAAAKLAEALNAFGRPLARAEGWPSPDPAGTRGSYFLKQVPVGPVIDFLRAFGTAEGSGLVGGSPLVEYILDRAELELAEWDILIPSVARPKPENPRSDVLGVPVHCQSRTARSDAGVILLSTRQRLASRGMERAGLSEDSAQEAEARFRTDYPQRRNIPDHAYRPYRTRPLLMVHLINPLADGGPPVGAPGADPLVGWSISFPRTRLPGKKVTYRLNATAMGAPNNQDEEESDEFEF